MITNTNYTNNSSNFNLFEISHLGRELQNNPAFSQIYTCIRSADLNVVFFAVYAQLCTKLWVNQRPHSQGQSCLSGSKIELRKNKKW